MIVSLQIWVEGYFWGPVLTLDKVMEATLSRLRAIETTLSYAISSSGTGGGKVISRT